MGAPFKYILCFAFFTVGCGLHARPKDACTSECQAIMTGADNCALFIAQETRSLAAYGEYSDINPDVLCEALQNWWFKVIDTNGRGWWQDDFGRQVTGMTHFYGEVVEIGWPNWGFNAYTHEIAHIYDGYTNIYDDSNQHKDWDKRGIYTVIEKTRYIEEK